MQDCVWLSKCVLRVCLDWSQTGIPAKEGRIDYSSCLKVGGPEGPAHLPTESGRG